MTTLYYLSVDIESEGDSFNNPVTSLGVIFGPADGGWPRSQLIRFRANLHPLPGQVPDPRCMAEFWNKNQDVYNEIKATAEDASVVMTRFLLFCQQLVANFEDNPSRNGKIKIVTDCPDLYESLYFF